MKKFWREKPNKRRKRIKKMPNENLNIFEWWLETKRILRKKNCTANGNNSEFDTNPSIWRMLRVDKLKIQLLNVV